MSEAKHTPGPWHKWRNSVNSEEGGYIAECGNSIRNTHLSETECAANTHLIAAAPELLSALEDMLCGWKYIREVHGDLYGVGWDRAQERATASIAKAKGVER